MPSTTVTLCKFVGTISLGLLTVTPPRAFTYHLTVQLTFVQGVSYTIATTTLPPILALPTAQPASTTFQHLRALTHRRQLILSTLSASALSLAYILSPPRGKHPFLLWATLAVGLGYSKDIYVNLKARISRKAKDSNGGASGSESGDEDWEVEGASTGSLNGEAVREGMERWRGKQLLRGVAFAGAWLVTVVGLWGDGMAVY